MRKESLVEPEEILKRLQLKKSDLEIELRNRDIELIGIIPNAPQVFEAGLEGRIPDWARPLTRLDRYWMVCCQGISYEQNGENKNH